MIIHVQNQENVYCFYYSFYFDTELIDGNGTLIGTCFILSKYFLLVHSSKISSLIL